MRNTVSARAQIKKAILNILKQARFKKHDTFEVSAEEVPTEPRSIVVHVRLKPEFFPTRESYDKARLAIIGDTNAG